MKGSNAPKNPVLKSARTVKPSGMKTGSGNGTNVGHTAKRGSNNTLGPAVGTVK